MSKRIAGAAVATPLAANLGIDHALLCEHALSLLQRGLDTLTLFGTTGEGASFSSTARNAAIAACADAGIKPAQLGCGIFAAAADEAAQQSREALQSGCGQVLLAPPSYFKGVDDEGLYAWFCRAIETCDTSGTFTLYHIPSVTQVELSVALCQRLASRFPGIVTAVKDSSGNWPHTERLIRERGELDILVGHEGQLARGMQAGASGSISGTANLLPEMIRATVYDALDDSNLPPLLDELFKFPIIPAIKALTAHRSGNPAWKACCPPLTTLGDTQCTTLGASLDRLFPV